MAQTGISQENSLRTTTSETNSQSETGAWPRGRAGINIYLQGGMQSGPISGVWRRRAHKWLLLNRNLTRRTVRHPVGTGFRSGDADITMGTLLACLPSSAEGCFTWTSKEQLLF